MKIDRKFNTFTRKEYQFHIDHHKKYTDFNTLGLYRSILENEKLTSEEKISVRDYANERFGKPFEFLQLKDPVTYIKLQHLGREITHEEHRQIWQQLRKNQEQILKRKRIKHRNFGVYSKHSCGFDDCPYNGVMFKQGVYWSDGEMTFDTDRCDFSVRRKSDMAKQQRKNKKRIIQDELSWDSEE